MRHLPPLTGPQFLNQLSLDVSLGDPAQPFPALAISHMDQETSAARGSRKMRIRAAGARGVIGSLTGADGPSQKELKVHGDDTEHLDH